MHPRSSAPSPSEFGMVYCGARKESEPSISCFGVPGNVNPRRIPSGPVAQRIEQHSCTGITFRKAIAPNLNIIRLAERNVCLSPNIKYRRNIELLEKRRVSKHGVNIGSGELAS